MHAIFGLRGMPPNHKRELINTIRLKKCSENHSPVKMTNLFHECKAMINITAASNYKF